MTCNFVTRQLKKNRESLISYKMFQTQEIFERNVQIYKKCLKGMAFSELEKKYNLSSERIRQICKRMKIRYEKMTTNSPAGYSFTRFK